MNPIKAVMGSVLIAGGAIIAGSLMWLYGNTMSYATQPNPFDASWAIGTAFTQITAIIAMVVVLAVAEVLLETAK